MTGPTSTPTLTERQWTLLERIVAKDSMLLSKMSDREVEDAQALLHEYLIDYDFDEARYVSDSASREALAAHVAPVVAAPTIEQVIAALTDAQTEVSPAYENAIGDVVWRQYFGGKMDGIALSIAIIRDLSRVPKADAGREASERGEGDG